jgi:hypothetical protein
LPVVKKLRLNHSTDIVFRKILQLIQD